MFARDYAVRTVLREALGNIVNLTDIGVSLPTNPCSYTIQVVYLCLLPLLVFLLLQRLFSGSISLKHGEEHVG